MTKKELRQHYLTKRKTLSEKEKVDFSKKIAEHLLDSDFMELKTFHVFLSVEKLNEIDTQLIINPLLKSGKQLVVPKMKGKKLQNCLLDETTILKTNSWGIAEPENCVEIDSAKIDVVIVPMLICDVKGNRIGYGGGFYDRFMATLRPDAQLVGINWFEPVEEIPAEEYDVPLDAVITPGGFKLF